MKIEVGSRVVTPDGRGRVVGVDVQRTWDGPRMRERRQAYALVLLDNGARRAFGFAQLEHETKEEAHE